MKKTKVPPKKKDRRGWPKGKPRKPKTHTSNPLLVAGRVVPAAEAWASIPNTTATEATASRQRTIAQPHKLGAEWQFMDLDEWRSNPTCVEYIQKLHADPMFRRFLGMLHSYASRTRTETPQNETSASNFLGRIQGRRDILEVIDVAAIANEPIVNPADFPAFAPGEPLGII